MFFLPSFLPTSFLFYVLGILKNSLVSLFQTLVADFLLTLLFCSLSSSADTLHWSKCDSAGISARFSPALVLHDELLYVFGGRNLYNFTFNDLYVCNLGMQLSLLVSPS